MITIPQSFINRDFTKPTLYLAGRMEGDDWRLWVESEIGHKYNLLNPKKNQTKNQYNNPELIQQLSWERNGMDIGAMVFYFDGEYDLFEFGLNLGRDPNEMFIAVSKEYRLKGTLEYYCNLWNYRVFTLENLMHFLNGEDT